MDKRPNLSSHKVRRTRLWQVRLYRVVGDNNRYTTKEKTNRLVGREWSQVSYGVKVRYKNSTLQQ